MEKVWIITGAARGLGLAIARAALGAGDRVVATARSPAALAEALGPNGDRLHAISLDVTRESAAVDAVREAMDRFGRIDVLVNNAAQAQLGWFETISNEEVRRNFDINVFGAMNVARAVLPHMRRQRSGLIVSITSVNGLVANPGGSVYSATKFAVEGWIEGLAQEIAPLGVRSLVVEPGMMRTDFLDQSSMRQGTIAIEDYAEAVAQFHSFIASANHKQPGDPAALAERIVALAAEADPPARLVYGADALEWSKAKVDRLRTEIDRSAELSKSTTTPS